MIHRFGNQYEIPLLVQSIVMNLAMLAIIQLCVTVKQSKQIIRAKEKLFTGMILSQSSLFHILEIMVSTHDPLN